MSLFPAYGGRGSEDPPSDADPSTSNWLSNASYQPPAPSPSPEVESEPELIAVVPARKRKKKSRERKQEPPPVKQRSSAPKATVKWGFSDKDPAAKAGLPVDLILLDRDRDIENLQYTEAYKHHTARFRYQRAKGLLTRKVISEKRRKDIWTSIYGEDTTSLLKLRRYWRRKKRREVATVGALGTAEDLRDDVVTFEPEKMLDSDGSELIYDARLGMYRAPETSSSTTKSEAEMSAWERGQAVNARLKERPEDVGLWLEFVEMQDAVAAEQWRGRKRSEETGGEKAASDREVLERKLAILDRGLAANSGAFRLKMARIRVGGEGLWDRPRLRSEWGKLEFSELNQPLMWQTQINWLAEYLPLFKVTTNSQLLDRAVEKLGVVLGGTVVTHPPLPNTERFLVAVIVQKALFLAATGFYEKGLAFLQAAIEFNFFMPKGVASAALGAQRQFFEPFWDSGVPRFGEPRASGWSNVKAAALNSEKTAEKTKTTEKAAVADMNAREDAALERCGGSEARLWLELEGLRERWDWRPYRGETEQEDLERIVLFDDIAPALITVKEHRNRVLLLLGFLRYLGAHVPEVEPERWDGEAPAPTFSAGRERLLQCFSLLPQIPAPSREGLEDLIREAFSQCRSVVSGEEELRVYFAYAELRHSAQMLLHQTHVPIKERRSDLKREAKSLLSSPENRSCLALYAAFAEGLLILGGAKEAADVAKTALSLSSASVWEQSGLAQVGALRLFVLLAEGDAKGLGGILAGLFLNGRLAKEPPSGPELVRARKRAWDIVTETLLPAYSSTMTETQTNSGSWLLSLALGSPSVLAARLAARLLLELDAGVESRGYRELLGLADSYLEAVETNDPPSLHLLASDRRQLAESRLRLAALHAARQPLLPSKTLKEEALVAAAKGESPEVMRRMAAIGSRGGGLGLVWLRRALEGLPQTTTAWLGRLEAEFARYVWLADVGSGSPGDIEGLRSAVNACLAQRPGEELLWRLLLRFEALRGDGKGAEVAFFRAVRSVPWSKAVYMDFLAVRPDKLKLVVDLMTEKELRVRTPIEEVELLLRAEKDDEEDPGDQEDGDERKAAADQACDVDEDAGDVDEEQDAGGKEINN